MSELDLIPEDYRNSLRQRAMIRQHVIAFVILNIIILVSSGLFAQLSQQAMERVQHLKSQSAITEQQQSQLEQLSAQQTEYERRCPRLVSGFGKKVPFPLLRKKRSARGASTHWGFPSRSR